MNSDDMKALNEIVGMCESIGLILSTAFPEGEWLFIDYVDLKERAQETHIENLRLLMAEKRMSYDIKPVASDHPKFMRLVFTKHKDK